MLLLTPSGGNGLAAEVHNSGTGALRGQTGSSSARNHSLERILVGLFAKAMCYFRKACPVRAPTR